MGQNGTTEDTGIGKQGISRRTLLKGGAVVGTALWVAPVVETLPAPAPPGRMRRR